MRASTSILYLIFILGVDVHNSISGDNERRCAFHSGANWRLMNVRRPQQRNVNIISSSIGNDQNKKLPEVTLAANSNNMLDALANAFGIKSPKQPTMPADTKSKNNNSKGQVIRTAARPHQSSGGSIPSSREYTTRKSSLPMISVSEKGVTGDYNHYRTVALKSTADRAISILTHDVSSYIQTLDGGSFAKSGNGYTDGDLGENVLVKGVDFSFFKVGGRYRFSPKSSNNSGNASASSSSSSIIESAEEDVIIEITEPMEPCANLCKRPFINDPSLSSARERVAKCQRFIAALGVKDGLRGWYAKVLSGGVIRLHDSVSLLGADV
mmetsp:Transcript_30077/g.45257  ORF Transcript_30077/g.45257 Transcript_30077/m.45257 type:complete len:325 (-) Transcript_30077:997-1971(-)